MTDQEKIQTERIAVVGLNRPRLTRIMGIVEEEEKLLESTEAENVLKLEYLACLAKMGTYVSEDGENVRFMSNFVYHDGSPMTKFFDDLEYRSSLKMVLLIGYEWNANDVDHIQSYFQANNLSLPVRLVQPNDGFENLSAEFAFFKSCSDVVKSQHLSQQTMGPGKMARFVVDTGKQLQKEKKEEIEAERAKKLQEEKAQVEQPTTMEEKPKRVVINPDLPRYACRMCRTVLFGENHLASGHVQNLHSFKRANYNARRPTVACQSIFCSVDVLEWLSENGQSIEGKLSCPKCSFKIGHWRWSGAQCSCGTWVTPAVQIPVSKVDTILPITTNKEASLTGVVDRSQS